MTNKAIPMNLTFILRTKQGTTVNISAGAFDALQIHQSKVVNVCAQLKGEYLCLTMNGKPEKGFPVATHKLIGNGRKMEGRWRMNATVGISLGNFLKRIGYKWLNNSYPCDCDPESKTIRCKLPEKEKE